MKTTHGDELGSIINNLPTFTITKIRRINSQTKKIYELFNPNPQINLPEEFGLGPEKFPSIITKLIGQITANIGSVGVNIPQKYAGYTAIQCWGVFNNVKNTQAIYEGSICYIYLRQYSFVEGRFLDNDPNISSGIIIVKDGITKDQLKVGASYPLLDCYWGSLAALILDQSRNWQRVKFHVRDGISVHNGQTEIIKGGWDHEHCVICHKRISEYEDEVKHGYTDQNDVWICQACYKKYVIPKSLALIDLDKIFYLEFG